MIEMPPNIRSNRTTQQLCCRLPATRRRPVTRSVRRRDND